MSNGQYPFYPRPLQGFNQPLMMMIPPRLCFSTAPPFLNRPRLRSEPEFGSDCCVCGGCGGGGIIMSQQPNSFSATELVISALQAEHIKLRACEFLWLLGIPSAQLLAPCRSIAPLLIAIQRQIFPPILSHSPVAGHAEAFWQIRRF